MVGLSVAAIRPNKEEDELLEISAAKQESMARREQRVLFQIDI